MAGGKSIFDFMDDSPFGDWMAERDGEIALEREKERQIVNEVTLHPVFRLPIGPDRNPAYMGDYGIDFWDDKKNDTLAFIADELNSHITKEAYFNAIPNQVPPPPYDKHGRLMLCIGVGKPAKFGMAISIHPSQVEIGAVKDEEKAHIANGVKSIIGDRNIYFDLNDLVDQMTIKYGPDKKGATKEVKPKGNGYDNSFLVCDAKQFEGGYWIEFEVTITKVVKKNLTVGIYSDINNLSPLDRIGEIVFYPNRPLSVNARIVQFNATPTSDAWHRNSDIFKSGLKNNISPFKQACIRFNIEKEVVHIRLEEPEVKSYIESVNTLRHTQVFEDGTPTDEYGNQINEKGEVLMYKDIKDFFLSKYLLTNPIEFKGILYFVVPFKTQDILGEGATTPRSANYCFLYLGDLDPKKFLFTTLHETAHVFGLYHSFLDRNREGIPIKITNIEENIETHKKEMAEAVDKKKLQGLIDKETFELLKTKEQRMVELNQSLFFKYSSTNNVMDYPKDYSKPPILTFFCWQWEVLRDDIINFHL